MEDFGEKNTGTRKNSHGVLLTYLLMGLVYFYLNTKLGFKKFSAMTAMIVSLLEWQTHQQFLSNRTCNLLELLNVSTVWYVSKYGVFSSPYLNTFHAVVLNPKSQKLFLLHKVYWPENYGNFPIFRPSSFSNCVKSVRIRSFSGLYFPGFRLTMEIYFVNLRISPYSVRMWKNTEQKN